MTDENEARAAGLLPADNAATGAVPDATHAILAERGARYGAFHDHAMLSQALKDVMRTGRSYQRLTASQREALEMIQHKVARILNGTPDYADSWADIAGYARLVADELEGVTP